MLLSNDSHKYFYGMSGDAYGKGVDMDYPNGSTCLVKRDPAKDGDRLEFACLRDVPLEIRRKEAKKPLFLKRYE